MSNINIQTANFDESDHGLNITTSFSKRNLKLNPTSQDNIGVLDLQATQGQSISVNNGDKVVFLDLPNYWTIKTKEAGWTVSKFSHQGRDHVCLVNEKKEALLMSSIVQLFSDVDQSKQGGTSISISLKIDPPAPTDTTNDSGKNNAIITKVQIFNRDGVSLSSVAPLLLSFVQPDNPLVAFAQDSTVVLLSDSGNVSFKNKLNITLLNQSSKTINSANFSLELYATDRNDSDVDLTQDLKNSISFKSVLTRNDKKNKWIGRFTEELDIMSELNLTMSGLSLTQNTIKLLEVRFTISGINGQETYTSSAWFQARGPYTLTPNLLDPTDDENAKYYNLTHDPKKNVYTVIPINPNDSDLRSPPLNSKLYSAKKVEYPPFNNAYSWDDGKTIAPVQASHHLNEGSNTLSYVVKTDMENKKSDYLYQTLASCTIDLDLRPKEFGATGYNQTYTDNDSKEAFGPIMPPGAIILWSGKSDSVPPGWVICDGSTYKVYNPKTGATEKKNSPNLKEKFVRGAKDDNSLGISSGCNTMNINNFPTSTFTGKTTTKGVHNHDLKYVSHELDVSKENKKKVSMYMPRLRTDNDKDNRTNPHTTASNGPHNHDISIKLNQKLQEDFVPEHVTLYYIMKI